MFTKKIFNKLFYFATFLFIVMIVTGCNTVNPAEEIYHHLEKSVNLEGGFEEQQTPLANAESEEYDLYEEILGLSDLEEIKGLALQAEEIANSRNSMIEKEYESIDQAYTEFLLIEGIVETIENEELKTKATELLETMQQRYDTYNDLYEKYKNAIALDIELYQIVQKEDLTIEELEEQHEKVNDAYKVVNELKEQFNELTIKYNNLKRQFYELGELEVVYN